MWQRSMLCTSQMLDLEMDQQTQGYLHPELCTLLGNDVNFPHPNVNPVLSASGNLDLRHLPDHHDRSIFSGNQYNGLPHHHPITNLDLGSAAPSNFYNPYMIPSSGSRVFPVPLNHGSSGQPSSSNLEIIGVGVDEYERNNHLMDGDRSLGKRKNAEGVPGIYHHVNGSASSSSSSLGAPLNTWPHQWEEQFESGADVLDASAFVLPEHRANGNLSIMEGGSRRSVTSRSGTIGLQLDSVLVHNQNHLDQGNYMGQSFQPASSAWVDQQFGSIGSNRSTSTWSYAPAIPYLHGRSVNGGSLEIGSMSELGYQDTTNNRNPVIFLHPSSMHHHHQLHHHHPLPPPMQGMQGHNYNYHPQVPIPSYRHPMNNTTHYGTLNPSRDSLETGTRNARPSNGLRMYRPHQSGVRQRAPEDRNRPRLRILSADEVAILEFPGFYEVGSFIDRHREMRLDIDDMSYEELLALEERIGNVKTGLSEETILSRLKTRIHVSSAKCIHLDESADMDQETETCVICQIEYKNQEKIGTLSCGHEYHADCIKQWLLVKNVCPICKTSALTVEGRDG